MEKREFQKETPTSGPTTTIAASEKEEMAADAPAIDHVTTSAAVMNEEESVEIAKAPLIDPMAMHATPVRNVELKSGQSTNGRPGVRTRARPSSILGQHSRKGCIPSMTVTADVHSACKNDSRGNINPQSLISTKDQSFLNSTSTGRKDHSSLRPTLNPLASEFVPASIKEKEIYSVDWPARERGTLQRTRMPNMMTTIVAMTEF